MKIYRKCLVRKGKFSPIIDSQIPESVVQLKLKTDNQNFILKACSEL